ncbi:hypothetical protein Q4610_01295 [Sphingobium sp. HBC34]|uniref:RHS repeat protein n=1 Tax=Sphingobium cyanobacteriorum TaxID=3063954 RepID=A0ABT8ZGK5_9SPHN|nr:hypothetical protein [Sphingobium sp. HBC34]MDO7833669.1 hypothetical protein [Sphingobium sp. HBC34]
MRRLLFRMGAGCALMHSLPVYAASTTTYSYDALGRLVQSSTTGAVNNGVQMSTTYDAADNRVTYKVVGSKDKVVIVPINGMTVIPIQRD